MAPSRRTWPRRGGGPCRRPGPPGRRSDRRRPCRSSTARPPRSEARHSGSSAGADRDPIANGPIRNASPASKACTSQAPARALIWSSAKHRAEGIRQGVRRQSAAPRRRASGERGATGSDPRRGPGGHGLPARRRSPRVPRSRAAAGRSRSPDRRAADNPRTRADSRCRRLRPADTRRHRRGRSVSCRDASPDRLVAGRTLGRP